MRILFDHNAPAPLIPFLPKHNITLARNMGWDRLPDGELLPVADRLGFDLFLTCDQRIKTQQNLPEFKIAIVVLRSSDWRIVERYVRRIAQAVDSARPWSYREVDMPFR